jgi:hypothetical protein
VGSTSKAPQHIRDYIMCVCDFPHDYKIRIGLLSRCFVNWIRPLLNFFPILVKKDIVNSTNRIDFLSANIWSGTSTQTFCPISNKITHHTWRNFANINQFWRQMIITVGKFLIIIDEELCGYTPRKPYVKPLQLLVGQL